MSITRRFSCFATLVGLLPAAGVLAQAPEPGGEEKSFRIVHDDTAINVEAANKAGFSAYLVDGITELEGQLDRLGFLSGVPSPTARPEA